MSPALGGAIRLFEHGFLRIPELGELILPVRICSKNARDSFQGEYGHFMLAVVVLL